MTAPFIPHGDEASQARFVGACKTCKHGASVLATARRFHRHYGFMYETERGHLGENSGGSTFSVWLTCHCGAPVRLWKVQGKYKPEKTCGSRCLASKGPTCECACGGKNHGSSYS